MRLYLLGSPAVQAEDLCFAEKDVEKVSRQVLFPLWNSYVFFATYAKIIGWQPKEWNKKPEAEIDQWVLSLLQGLVQEVTAAMDRYELNRAVTPIQDFIEQLTNWYIRRNRSRFWAGEESLDREEALATLYTVLKTLVRVLAPFAPFLSEAIYLELRQELDPPSVHLTDFPVEEASLRNPWLEKEMALAQKVVSSGHALRKECKMKVRQPLALAHLVSTDESVLQALRNKEHLIAEELNVKRVLYHQEETHFVSLVAKPNFRVLGKKVGNKMNLVQRQIADMTKEQLQDLLQGKEVTLIMDGEALVLSSEDVSVERKVLEGVVAHSLEGITVALDTQLTLELIEEGIAREMVNRVNTLRKELDFAITDRITLRMQASSTIKTCIEKYKEYLCGEVLAQELLFVDKLEGTPCEVHEETVILALQVV
ncbi:MAG: class I tRNA ligase family protein [Chlamydiae bacterium]|nr:class I tRNA ligase family protein [Chlamydiota bacterium]